MLKIALTNLRQYNEGDLIFEWVELPCDDFKPVFDKIGHDEYFISDYECERFNFHIDEYEKLQYKLQLCDEEPEKRDLRPLKTFLESDFRTLYDSLKKEEKRSMWRSIIKFNF